MFDASVPPEPLPEMEPGADETCSAGEQQASDEVRLIAALLARDRKATGEFVQRYSVPVQRYLTFRLSPRYDLVDDLVQEVFLAAWGGLPKFRGGSSLQTWLLGIARHKVEDYYRGVLRQALSLDEVDEDLLPEVSGTEIEWEIDYERLQKRTQRVMASLSAPYRVALLWRYWEKRSARDVARETGRTEKAVERLLSRARQKFKETWIEEN